MPVGSQKYPVNLAVAKVMRKKNDERNSYRKACLERKITDQIKKKTRFLPTENEHDTPFPVDFHHPFPNLHHDIGLLN